MNARYYNSNTGRFISQDSYKGSAYAPWTQNLYTYTGNNPVNFVDPTGHYFSRPQGAYGSQTPDGYDDIPYYNHDDGTVVPDPPSSGGSGSNGENEGEFYASGYGGVITPDGIVLSNVAYGKVYDLGNGWYYRFDRAVSSKYYDHLHVYKSDGTEDYSQSFKDGGGDHHTPKGGKKPPNSVLKKIKAETGYDWKKYRNKYNDKIVAEGFEKLNQGLPSMFIVFPLSEFEAVSASALTWDKIIEWLTQSPTQPVYTH